MINDKLTVDLDELARKSCERVIQRGLDFINRRAWEHFEKGMFGTSVPQGGLHGQKD
jgi:hypothetical protein